MRLAVLLLILVNTSLFVCAEVLNELPPAVEFILTEDRDTTSALTPLTKIDTVKNSESVKDIELPNNWTLGGNGSLNFAQGYLSHWVEGGESSVSTHSVVMLYCNYKRKNLHWDNSLSVKYGLLKSGEKDLRKNEDKLELNTKYGQKAFRTFYYSFMINLKTQVDKGYEFPKDSAVYVSDFFAPAEALMAIGMDYKPSNKFSLLLSPVTSKSTYVMVSELDETKYGLEEGSSKKFEMGAYVKTLLKWDITKDILLQNKLDFFTNYLKNPENIDVNWEVGIAMKINKYIHTNINTHLIYDDDIMIPVEKTRISQETGLEETYMGKSKKIQFKEVLSVGISYKF
jgi:hypothetical protein